MAFKQAERGAGDGGISVLRLKDPPGFLVGVEQDGKTETVTMSDYNAARVFATLGFMLAGADGLGDSMALLSKLAQREIKL